VVFQKHELFHAHVPYPMDFFPKRWRI
jgi:hypothetical protein